MTADPALIPRKASGPGVALGLFGGFVLSFDIPLIRLAEGTMWSVTAVRCGSVALAGVLLFVLMRLIRGTWPSFETGSMGLLTTALYAGTSVLFIAASFHTTAANLVFIVAFSPVLSAALAWWLMGERPARQTIIAACFMILGVGIIVQDSLQSDGILGNVYALMTAFGLSLAITLTRKHDLDMRFNVLAANAVPAAIALLVVSTTGTFVLAEPHWSVINGAVVIPLSFLCLAYIPRLLPGAVVAMFYLVETILAPIWVWLFLNETISTATFIGGAIMLVTLLVHSVWQAGLFSRAAIRPMPSPDAGR